MPVETRWWHTERDKVVCTLCPRECHIPVGSRGFCFVRANVDGKLELTTDGRSSGFCIDPVEKKPLNHFLPGTPILSFGTAGCNLGCRFCQNWDISKSRQMDRLADEASPEAIIDAARQSGCRSVAFTYNDPVIWAEYAIEISKVARREGIKTVAVTAGYITPDARKEFYQWMDAANVDLKAFTETFYRKLTKTHLEPVLDTLKYLKHETDVWFEITNLMIPGENDSVEETEQMCRWIVDNLGDEVPLHFSAFHPDYKMMDTPQTPHETLIGARQIARDCGIKYAYVGNVYDLQHQSTYCPNCGVVVIERDWYELGEYRLDRDRCEKCGQRIPGVFEEGRGNWGRKRVPVTIGKDRDRITVTTRAPRRRGQTPAAVTPTTTTAASTAATVATDNPQWQATSPETTSRAALGAADGTGSTQMNTTSPKIDFDEHEAEAILAHTRHIVEATIKGAEPEDVLPVAIADAPSYGVFVSLRRMSQLRACRGRWGGTDSHKLGDLICEVAADAAQHDTRFPSVTEEELAYLALDVSLMFNPQPVTATGEDRIDAVTVGKHGLVINHPSGRGLLLPHVATEANWDAKQLLDGVCRKAGLPLDTWRRDNNAQLMTFEARIFSGEAPTAELDSISLTGHRLQELIERANRQLIDESLPERTDEILSCKHGEELGLRLYTTTGFNTTAIGPGHSLTGLAEIAADSLKDLFANKHQNSDPIARLVLLWQPIRLRPQDYPNRHRGLTNHAVFARYDSRWTLVLPASIENGDRVGTALSKLALTAEDWKLKNNRVTAFSMVNFEARKRPAGPHVRRPARAGQFYPAEPDAMSRAVDGYLEAGRLAAGDEAPKAHRAIMLPHAGWQFCCQTIGRTLARTTIPDTIVIIGPKHTPHGKNWSVAPHDTWDIPGASVPIATELAKDLVENVPGLECDPEAHRMEHGSEVLVPFLRRLNGKVRILPIVIAQSSYDATGPLAEALANLYHHPQVSGEKPLLVISSDMNHFAAEPENRRLDYMALDAMRTGDPRRLYDTCAQHNISMCGFIPACIIMQALLKLSPDLEPELVHYSNSAETTGDTSRVVGYAGVLLD